MRVTFVELRWRHLQYPIECGFDYRRVQRVLGRAPETVICFVGVSGIGKSTLLNAIVAGDRTLVPSGGVGPLTALATEVRYSPQGYVRVWYQPKQRLWRVAFALNVQIERARKTQASETAVAEVSAADVQPGPESEAEAGSQSMTEFLRMARLMVAGNQDEERPIEYLADALATACSVVPRWNSTLSNEDARRIERIRQAIALAERDEPLEQHDSGSREFRDALTVHAAGFLSPLIRRIEVGWPSAALADGLVLVDLPGVGVANDVYQGETQKFVREKSRAVILVMNRSGLTQAVADLLESTGYWDRLLLASDDPDADPCSLIMAVTHVDDLAEQQWRDLDRDHSGHRPKAKRHVFGEVQAQLREGLRKQLEQHLAEFKVTADSSAVRDARESAARQLLQTVQIHPVSAVQLYQLAGDIRQIVEEICDLAATEHAAYVDPRVIERQKKLVSGQVERLRDVGKEAIDDLRDVVKNKIVEAIQKPIRKACDEFVEQGSHVGPGVKQRILEMFRELAAKTTDDASVPALRTLSSKYDAVHAEIHTAFEEWGQPLEAAVDAIVERHEDRMRRSDGQKRQKVIAQIAQMRSEAPCLATVLDDAKIAATQGRDHGSYASSG